MIEKILKMALKMFDNITPEVYTFRMIKVWNCLRCGHEWASKMDKPHICPKCKSPYWHTPKGVLKMGRPRKGGKK